MAETDAKLNVLVALKSSVQDRGQLLLWLKNASAGLVAAAGAYALFAAKQSLKLGADLQHMAESADMTTDAFQVLVLNGAEWNVQQEKITVAAQRLRKSLQEASANAASPLNKELAALNLTAAGLQAIAPERQWEAIGRSIATTTDRQAALNAVTKLFGEEDGPRLFGLLEALGTKGYDKLADKVEKVTLDPQQIADLEAADTYLGNVVNHLKWLAAHATVSLVQATTGETAQQQGRGRAESEADAFRARIVAAGEDAEKLAAIREQIAQRRKEIEEDLQLIERVHWESNAPLPASDQAQLTYGGKLLQDLRALEEHLASTNIDRDLAKQVAGAVARQKQMEEATAAAKAAAKAEKEAEDAKKKAEEDAKEAAAKLAAQMREGEQVTAKTRTATEAYAAELSNLSELYEAGAISAEVYARAVSMARSELTSKTALPAAQLALSEELQDLARKRSALEYDFTRTAAEKWSERKTLLSEEIAAQNRYIDNLRKMQQGADENTAATYENLIQSGFSQLNALRDQQAALGPDPGNFIDQLRSQLTALRDEWGTTAEQIAGGIRGTIGTAVDTMGDNITGVLMRSQSLGEAWENIRVAIGQHALSAIVNFGVRWLATKLMLAAADKGIAAASTAALLPIAAAQSAIWAVPATLATIATLGTAAALAPVQIGLAKAATLAQSLLPGYAVGGPPRPGKHLAWLNEEGQEFVFSAPATAALGVDFLTDLHNSAKDPARASSSATGTGGRGGGRTRPHQMFVVDSRSQVDRLRDDGNFKVLVRDLLSSDPAFFGLPS